MPTIYKGKPLEDFSDWELSLSVYEFLEAEKKREEASQHHKFDKVKNKKAMDFPSINPEYLKLKSAIIEEIEKRKSNA